MTAANRVVALIEAQWLERACGRLHELGLDDGDLRVGPITGPAREVAELRAPGLPVRRAHLVLARTVGAVPGAFAGLAITLGVGLTVTPAILVITAAAALGMVAVTGRVERPAGATEAHVIELPRTGEYVRLEARCADGRVVDVQEALRSTGATVLDDVGEVRQRPTRPGPASTPGAADRPAAPPDDGAAHDTPPGGLTPVPR